MEDNPFTKVYNLIWFLAERNNSLKNLIKINNREKYSEWIGVKNSISTADFPELALIVDGGSWNFQYTSSHSRFVRIYTWALTTGDFTIKNYNEILWELCRAMVDWDTYVCPVTWEGVQVVTNATQGDLTEGTLKVEQTRDILGWASLWSLEVEFMIPTSLMRLPTN